MNLKGIFNSATAFIDPLKQILVDNKELVDKLDKAGGLLSLIGIGLDLYAQNAEDRKSPEEKLFLLFLKLYLNLLRK